MQRETSGITNHIKVFRKYYPHYCKGGKMIKGYVVPDGYMGLVKGKYQLFASENDYLEYVLINEEV